MNDFTYNHPGHGFDILLTESEYWNYPASGAPTWPTFKNLIDNLVTLKNNGYATSIPPHPSSNFKIDVYTIVKDLTPNQNYYIADEVSFLETRADIISLTDYSKSGDDAITSPIANIVSYWAFLPGLAAFDATTTTNTIVPLLSFDHFSTQGVNSPGLGDWLDDYNGTTYTYSNPSHTFQTAEQNLFLSIPTQTSNVLSQGVFNWFRFTEASHSNNSYSTTYNRCSNNEVFYVAGAPDYCASPNIITACKGSSVTFKYVSNYETGPNPAITTDDVTCDWNFGDGATSINQSPGDKSHIYSNSGTYTVMS